MESLTRWDGVKSRLQEWKQLHTWRGEAAFWASCIHLESRPSSSSAFLYRVPPVASVRPVRSGKAEPERLS